jgi:hypothetical protein
MHLYLIRMVITKNILLALAAQISMIVIYAIV